MSSSPDLVETDTHSPRTQNNGVIRKERCRRGADQFVWFELS